ncbi:MacB family efflux pump subunit [Pokkaliibacter sp. MBI-7]|uniref:MacB family efflux pump subunit n=1 Tax=Pokkaliibacter sp. MBI-7 TaxID=3040600 RepID=UPI00244AFE9A|nr:MacB family efflux pump subunit [Pokkaliibacter sp. MBI-7]MDH2432729.1 MacB family efflux pump subunit [Pokkaliibacter sp. MBI-7]
MISSRPVSAADVASQSATPLIALQGITKTFRNGDLEVEVLHGIDLQIHAGEFVAIMGTSGSGKSTLMNILGCLDQASSGQYRFRGEDVSTLQGDELARLRRESFGFVFQSYNLIATATARENVEVPAIYTGLPAEQRQQRAAELLTSLGLENRQDHRPSQLSGGQQQRVSIARALMNGGQIILADEPTGALDSRSGEDVMALLQQLSADGHTVILITHDRQVAEHADRIIEIRDGHILSDSLPKAGARQKGVSRDFRPAEEQHRPLVDITEAARMALRALHANVFRTVLTLLGIVIGVGSVITMLAIGDGAKQAVIDRISAMGSNLLLVRPGAPNQRGRSTVATLVEADVRAISELPNVLAAIPELTGTVTARAGGNDHATETNATSAQFTLARNWPLAEGTFFTSEDEAQYATVAVLGKTVAQALFPDRDPLGQYVMLNAILFQVIGIMSERGASPMGQDQDDVIFVPYSTGSLRLFGQKYLRNVTVAAEDVEQIDDTQAAVSKLLLERHQLEDFQIRNMASIIETASATQNTLTVLLGSIAAISLLVGGIGVMNIMLVSVTERTREIGIRMATGARTGNIQQQFLIEAMVVSALGGLLGVAGGLGVAALLDALGTSIRFSLLPVVLAFGCAFATGLVFGYLPARKAARLDPVVALASE